MKKKLFLLFFYILICFFSAELFLRFFAPQDISTPWRIYLSDGLLLNKNKGKAFHYFKSQKKAEYTFGLFHNRKYNLKNSDNKILILGDSNAFGWLLNDKETYIYKIAKKFNDYEFINSTAGGHGTSDQLSYFLKFCEKIKPKFTFVLINFADIERSKISNLFYLDENDDLKKGKNEIPKIYKITENSFIYDYLVSNYHTVSFLRKLYVVIKLKSDYKNKEIKLSNIKENKNNKKFIFEKKLYKKFKDHALKCETELYLINIAWFDPNEYQSDTYKFLNENIDFFNQENLNYINISESMKIKYLNPEKYTIKDDGHPNAEANELYFKILYKVFNKILN